MKKIYYLFALIAVVFASCDPMSKTYKELGDLPKPTVPVVIAPTIAAITLTAADYAFLPASNVANTQLFFHGTTDAFASIPSILTKKYPTAGDKSQITVTYATSPAVPTIKLADSLYADVAYTPTTADYFSVTVKYSDFSTAQAIAFLALKYPTPAANQLSVLNYTYYESGVTASAGVPNTVHSYLYLNGVWTKIYTISPTQYTAAGRGNLNEFIAADAPNLPSIFNTFLKADVQVMAAPKVGDVIYISYNYYASKDYQRVMPMVYDGINWIASSTTATNLFTLSGGVWAGQLDNTVSYQLSTANYATIASIPGIGSSAAIANLASRSNFAIAAGSAVTSSTDDGVRWTDVQIANGIIAILKAQYTAPATNQKFFVTFSVYGGYSTEIDEFIFDGKNFVYQPVQDQSKYTLTGDDFTAISRANTGATSAASLNLNQYGDFSSAWTTDQIYAGINTVLKTRYTTATANKVVAATYAVYSGGNVITTKNFKFDGTNWVVQ